MTSTPARERRPSRRMRVVTVAALFSFGCTVIRAPASGMDEVIPVRDGRVEPQLALWVEGGSPVTAQQSQEAVARARAVLSEAAQGLEAPEEGLLVVRAQGLTRTGERKSDQTAAIVGIAVGIVVIVAVVVLVLVAEAKGGGGGGAKVPGIAAAPKSSGGAAPKVAPAVHAAPAARVATGTGVRVAPVPHGGRGGFRPAPAPGTGPVPRVRPAPVPYVPAPHGGVVVYGGVDVNLWYPWYPCCDYWGPYPYPATVTETTTVWTAPPAATDVAPYAPALAPEGDELAFEDGELEPEPPRPVEQLQLGKVQPLPVDKRGFFDGDDMVIELVVVDRMTGEPRLRKVARRAIDPCDVKAVRQLLQDTLKKGTWERLSPASS